jgi:hypothetical protein
MSPVRQADPELDSLIKEITVDCHDEYEQLTASRQPSRTTRPSRARAPSPASTSTFYPSPARTTVTN